MTEHPDPSPAGADRRILVVDDDRDFADTLVHLLRLDGFEVETAYGMTGAKQALTRFAPRIALIDIRLADESGLDLVSEIAAEHPSISCVMMTAYASVDTAVAALQHGAYDYLQKPFYTQDLLSTINRCLERDALVRDRDRAEARLRDIIDYSPSMIALQDLDGRFLVVNKRFEEWLGVPGERAVGRAVGDVLAAESARIFNAGPVSAGPVSADRARTDAQGAYGQGAYGDECHEEVVVDLADGAVHTLLLTRFPVQASDGRVQSVGTIATDVTAHRRAEDKLRQAQKMEALGQLTGGIAHDFNNLLAVIAGNLSLAREDAAGQGEFAELIEDAFDAARSGAELTHRLLAFGRQQALQPQRVDSRELVMKMSRVLARTFAETIEIVAEPDDDLWPIMVDRSQLETCLLNLALNGRDAMAGGGKLRITARNAELPEPGRTVSGAAAPGHFVLIAVSDTGSGMADDVVGRAIQPFFTTKSAGQGSGLGLSMVDGFVEQSGGRLEISSAPGRGTTMRVYLPRLAEQDGDRKPIEARPADCGGHGERILVVEDQPKVRRLACRMLERLGYDVLQSDTAAGALDILSDEAGIDLLFTDVVLPGGMSGIELADAARQTRPGLRILYTSGYAPELVLDANSADQGAPLVSKPFQSDDLARMVRRVLELPP